MKTRCLSPGTAPLASAESLPLVVSITFVPSRSGNTSHGYRMKPQQDALLRRGTSFPRILLQNDFVLLPPESPEKACQTRQMHLAQIHGEQGFIATSAETIQFVRCFSNAEAQRADGEDRGARKSNGSHRSVLACFSSIQLSNPLCDSALESRRSIFNRIVPAEMVSSDPFTHLPFERKCMSRITLKVSYQQTC